MANATRQTRRRGRGVQRAARTRYARYFFIFYPILIVFLAYHHPQPPKTSAKLVFRRFTSPWLPPPTTTPENKHDGSFSGGLPLPGNHYHPQPPKTSRRARFRGYDLFLVTTTTHHPPKTSTTARFQEVHLSLATTTTHNPPKRARRLVFGRSTSPWQSPLPKTSATARFRCSPSPPSLKQRKRSISSKFRCLITFLYLIPPYNPFLTPYHLSSLFSLYLPCPYIHLL